MMNLLYEKKCYVMPGEYNELTGKQIIALSDVLTKNLPKEILELMVMRILLEKSYVGFGMISTDVKERLREFVQWVFEKNALTTQMIPVYKRWFKKYVGPASEFDNLTLLEFHFCEIAYREYVIEDSIAGLNKLVAVLYRPQVPGYDFKKNSLGDGRVPFNANELAYHTKRIAEWPLKVKLAILMYYDGCRQSLLDNYQEVFKGDSGKENTSGMFGVIRGLAGAVYGTLEKVEQLPIHTALLEISLQIEESEEIKSNTPKV